MIRLSVTASLSLASLILAPMAHAQDVTGEWTGKYICGQGVTALHLTIEKTSASKMISATFAFGPVPENPDVPNGAYTMKGTYDAASRRVRLNGEKWINAPAGYIMVPLDGYLSVSGARITGRVPDAFPCSDFEVWRPTQLIG